MTFKLPAWNRPPQTSRSFGADESGAVAIIFGLMAFVIFGFTGAGIDTTRWLQARRVTIDAMEAGALAGLREYQENGGDKAKAEALALANYRGNTINRMKLKNDTASFELVDTGARIKMVSKGSAQYLPAFLPLIGVDALPVVKMNGTENPEAELAVGQNSGTSLEISLMLDITGSMNESDGSGSTKLKAMKEASKKLIDIVIWEDQSKYTSRIALVPFSEGVNLGDSRAALVRIANPPSSTKVKDQNNKDKTWKLTPNCVVERTDANKYTDESYANSKFVPLYTTSAFCPTAASPIMPLDSDKTALKKSIDAYEGSGLTAGHIGTAWAWYTLSPNFNALWGNAKHNARGYSDLSATNDKGHPSLAKYAVLMTDGAYNTQYCNSTSGNLKYIGMPDKNSQHSNRANCTSPNGSSNSQALALCTEMKKKGITVFTVGFRVGTSEKNLLKSCASAPEKYYDAKDGNALTAAFTDIAYKFVPPFVSH
ncbi:MAG: pilus assembly protein TadG-related protein [Hyphomicrobium aestuarii]|nr:pilus assembly protein TadG-related protein [Hyphomicrobium aestuarii]